MSTALVLAVGSLTAAVLVWPSRPARPARPRSTSRWRAPRPPVRSTGCSADDLLALMDLVGAQVSAGAPPNVAWLAAHDVLGLDDGAGTGSLIGPDPGGWLRRVARDAGERRADDVAIAATASAVGWALAERTGAPLVEVLDAVAGSVRAQVEVATDVEAALAGPRATARLLAGLPVAGLGLGQLIGAHPLTVLTTTATGRGCAGAGLTLLVLGHGWMRRLVRAAAEGG